jgi:hypothetical protein
VGAVSDADEAEASELLLTTLGSRVPPGATAVVADANETAPAVLDAIVTRLGGKVTRRSHLEVEAELAAAGDGGDRTQRLIRPVLVAGIDPPALAGSQMCRPSAPAEPGSDRSGINHVGWALQ